MKSEKAYHITFENRPEYIYVFVKADEDNYEITIGYWREVAERCQKNRCKKLLVEEDIPKMDVSVAELYQFANEMVAEFAGVRIAFVDRYIEQQELNKFAALVAENRGLTARVFNDFDEAESWLLAG